MTTAQLEAGETAEIGIPGRPLVPVPSPEVLNPFGPSRAHGGQGAPARLAAQREGGVDTTLSRPVREP